MSKPLKENSVSITNEQILVILKAKKLDDVKFIINPNNLIKELELPINTGENKIILYRLNEHLQAILIHKNNQNELEVFIFDSFGNKQNKSQETALVIDSIKPEKDFAKINIFCSKNQRQGTDFGCRGFAIRDVEIMMQDVNIVLKIIENGFSSTSKNKFLEFVIPPEYMMATQKLDDINSYKSDLMKMSTDKEGTLKRLTKLEEEIAKHVVKEEFPITRMKRTDTMSNLQGLINSDVNKKEDKPIMVLRNVNKRNELYLLSLRKIIEEESQSSKPSATVRDPEVPYGYGEEFCRIL